MKMKVDEYFEVLQLEYLQAEFRRMIHHSPKQKRYWARVCAYKKQKIEDINIRNNFQLESIFTHQHKMIELKSMVFPDRKNTAFKFALSEDELKLYFADQAVFEVEIEHGLWKIGKLRERNGSLARMRLKGCNEDSFHNISKIFRLF